MLFADPIATDEVLEGYYAECFGSGILRDGQALASSVACRAIMRLVSKPSNLGQVLDVGTGYGFLLKELASYGVGTAIGVEPSAPSVEFAITKLGVDVRRGLLHESPLERQSFDTVVMMEVVEHLVDPVRVLNEAARFLRPGGQLVVGTDNFGSSIVNAMGSAWPKWIPHLHVSHFTPHHLLKVLERSGFRAEAWASYTPWECYGMLWKRRLLRRQPSAIQAGWIDSALARDRQPNLRGRRMRQFLAPRWFDLTAGRHQHASEVAGSMMYVLARLCRD